MFVKTTVPFLQCTMYATEKLAKIKCNPLTLITLYHFYLSHNNLEVKNYIAMVTTTKHTQGATEVSLMLSTYLTVSFNF